MVTAVPDTQTRNRSRRNDSTTVAYYERKAAELQTFWQPRNDQFKIAYKRLRLEDNLKQPNMESFISNDPRTLYNLALYLLTQQQPLDKIPVDQGDPVVSQAIATTEDLFASAWSALDKKARDRGEQSWLMHQVKLMLSTGWYAVFTMADAEGHIADIWNPAETYPEFSDGLSAVAHIYTLSAAAARAKIAQKGWNIEIRGNSSPKVIDYWELGEGGTPTNTIILDRRMVKPPTPHPEFTRIPVFVSPIGGLPDNGAIEESDENWKKNLGDSIVTVNEQVYENYNRQMTFLQQILRDTAQPKFKERSRSRNVLDPTKIFVRGAVFRMDVDEDVGIIDMPGVPPELRTQLFDIQGMLQRGGFPYSLYGGGPEVGAYIMSLQTAAATQVLKPFRDALVGLRTDINNFWLQMSREHNIPVQGNPLPVELPLTRQFQTDVRVQIPGDIAIRANTARSLNPNISLSESTVIDLLFPEVRDPVQELATRQRDEAMRNPVMAQISLANALRGQAESVAIIGDTDLAQLYTKAAEQVEAQILGVQAQAPASPPSGITGPGVNIQP